MANVFYLGDTNPGSTASHRAGAIARLGHSVTTYDPFTAVSWQLGVRHLNALHYRTGYRLLQTPMANRLTAALRNVPQRPDLVWVDSGELLGPASLKVLKRLGCPVVLYNVDDPTGQRDGRRFDSLLRAMPDYDLVAVVRAETEQESRKLGAKRVMRVLRSYDEVAHRPFASEADIPPAFLSDVAFIGTWMRYEQRDEFMVALLRQGVPISIWGDRWEKSPHWDVLRAVHRGGALGGREYVAAIQGAKLCLGLLSKGNRDLHTQRSLEVPFARGLLCAERTSEHQAIYHEGTEAVFWSDAEECAEVCKTLLAEQARRERIRQAGKQRVESLHVGNEDIARKILAKVL